MLVLTRMMLPRACKAVEQRQNQQFTFFFLQKDKKNWLLNFQCIFHCSRFETFESKFILSRIHFLFSKRVRSASSRLSLHSNSKKNFFFVTSLRISFKLLSKQFFTFFSLFSWFLICKKKHPLKLSNGNFGPLRLRKHEVAVFGGRFASQEDYKRGHDFLYRRLHGSIDIDPSKLFYPVSFLFVSCFPNLALHSGSEG